MPIFCDIHNHSLYGVDDGARSRETTLEMIDHSYAEGVRLICFTPHFNPNMWGDNASKIASAYDDISKYCTEKYSDLRVFLGNELRYDRGCEHWVASGSCNKLGNSRYVLIDFDYDEKPKNIEYALMHLLNIGIRPVLAHAERYRRLHLDNREIVRFHNNGVLIQIDADSILGHFGFWGKIRANRIISSGLCTMISSDAHNMSSRKSYMLECYDVVCNKYGSEFANNLFYENSCSLFS